MRQSIEENPCKLKDLLKSEKAEQVTKESELHIVK